MNYTHVIFDLDDTLIQTQIRYEQVKKKVADRIKHMVGTAMSTVEILELFHRIDIENVHLYKFEKKRFPLGWAETYEAVAGEWARKHERDEIYNLAYTIHEQRFELYYGAVQVLDDLKSRGVKLTLLTIGEKESQLNKVREVQLTGYFEEIIVVEDQKYPVLNALRDKGKTVMIGNSLRSDIQPALDAGVAGIHINHDSWSYDAIDIDETHPLFNRVQSIRHVMAHLNEQVSLS